MSFQNAIDIDNITDRQEWRRQWHQLIIFWGSLSSGKPEVCFIV